MYLCCYVYSLCCILYCFLFTEIHYMWSNSIYTLFRIYINYTSNLCFEIIKALYLFRICLNFILLLTRIMFCPYYCDVLIKPLKFIIMNIVKNYSDVFGLPLTETSLNLINTCKYINKDKNGKYVLTAKCFDLLGNVTFVKEYITK
jgi:hypothetical protein